ncbi:hypothetical protein [Phenylobacterium sp.]|uniref:hypothetical protein n=1 Tax=Phenylobacterium sp. TaxID=1871053 RepID=UPI0012222B40|nr:hypothetical protein [Phenylobacterium sp.]THD58177.1 MAG: hypothetical protein E8A12_12720 [Phenylobacterium sp.]
MLNEHTSLAGEQDQLSWAFGALRASFVLPGEADPSYAAVLAVSLAALTLYQWSADESVVTLAILCLLGLGLGFLRPSRFLVSGLAVGVVVAAVNSFETVSGLHPAYEIHTHSLTHDLRWLFLLAPALASSAVGRRAVHSLAA